MSHTPGQPEGTERESEGQQAGGQAQQYATALQWLFTRSRGGLPRDLRRMRRLIEELDLQVPPRSVRVVGSNGKGSITNLLYAIGLAAGLRTGRFISPHVEDFRERIAANGAQISASQVVRFVGELQGRELPDGPAFFELTLALALRHFRAAGVQLGIFEAGVGARDDATAALGTPELVVVTPISLDHVATLGPTLAHVAADKSHAIQPGTTVVSARQVDAVMQVLGERAGEVGARLLVEGNDPLFALPAGIETADEVSRQNFRVATAAARMLGIEDPAVIRRGLTVPPLPARAEKFAIRGRTVILDGCHDPAGAQALLRRVRGNYTLLFSALGKKQVVETLDVLAARADTLFLTSIAGQGASLREYPGARFVQSAPDALLAALDRTPAGGQIVVAGSFYLAGELRPLLRDLQG